MSGIIQNLFLLQNNIGAELQSKIDNLEFFKDEDEIDRTIDGDECQNWNSHKHMMKLHGLIYLIINILIQKMVKYGVVCSEKIKT